MQDKANWTKKDIQIIPHCHVRNSSNIVNSIWNTVWCTQYRFLYQLNQSIFSLKLLFRNIADSIQFEAKPAHSNVKDWGCQSPIDDRLFVPWHGAVNRIEIFAIPSMWIYPQTNFPTIHSKPNTISGVLSTHQATTNRKLIYNTKRFGGVLGACRSTLSRRRRISVHCLQFAVMSKLRYSRLSKSVGTAGRLSRLVTVFNRGLTFAKCTLRNYQLDLAMWLMK